MNTIAKMLLLITVLIPWLAACAGSGPPPLAQTGQPTLVFIYTDG